MEMEPLVMSVAKTLTAESCDTKFALPTASKFRFPAALMLDTLLMTKLEKSTLLTAGKADQFEAAKFEKGIVLTDRLPMRLRLDPASIVILLTASMLVLRLRMSVKPSLNNRKLAEVMSSKFLKLCSFMAFPDALAGIVIVWVSDPAFSTIAPSFKSGAVILMALQAFTSSPLPLRIAMLEPTAEDGICIK